MLARSSSSSSSRLRFLRIAPLSPRILKMSTKIEGPKRVVVIGAGWAGLVAAKTYLEVDPSIDLTIFDSQRTLGGVWNADRCFPGLLADSPSGLFDYSDLPMRDVLLLKDWSDLPGDQVYAYLKAYAKKFDLVERMRLGTTVSHVARNIDGKNWDLKVGETGETITCNKLVVATGLNSTPYWPKIPQQEYTGLLLHSKDLGLKHQDLTSDKINRVTVYGGCKSGIEAVTMALNAGKPVDWVIRDTGNGPGMIVQLRKAGIPVARFAGRWKNILTPTIFTVDGFWYRFLHSGQSKLGTWLCHKMWSKASTVPLTQEPYKSGGPNIEKLKPETGDALFFTAGLSGLHGNETFTRELRTGNLLTVHRASITSLTGREAHLSNGTVLPSDAAVFATGWESKSTLLSEADSLHLGLPTFLENEDAATAQYWQQVTARADQEVTDRLPILKTPPPHFERPVPHTPFRLYRYILPTALAEQGDRSLIFCGFVTSVQTSIFAEVSALWGVAWMEGLLDIEKSKEELDYEVAKVNAFCERRYLSRGRTRQIASAEIQEVTDLLMQDLGLKVYRKSNLIAEIFAPARAQDYKGIVQDLLKQSRGEKSAAT